MQRLLKLLSNGEQKRLLSGQQNWLMIIQHHRSNCSCNAMGFGSGMAGQCGMLYLRYRAVCANRRFTAEFGNHGPPPRFTFLPPRIWRRRFSARFASTQKAGSRCFLPEHFTTRSQNLPMALHDAGQFYWGRPAAWLSHQRVDRHSCPLLIPRWRVQDIDTEEDWRRAELIHQALFAGVTL